MPILAALVLVVLPGSWIVYGLPLSGIASLARLAMAIALSPSVVGLQLAALEAVGVPFAVSAYVLVVVNLPCVVLLVRHHRSDRVTGSVGFWLSAASLLALLVAIPTLVWSQIPNVRPFAWSAMLHTDVVYAVTRAGVHVEEASLAGFSLAYGWVGHSYWSLIGWIGGWPPTAMYPFTNILWIFVTFVLAYYLGASGLGLHRASALMSVGLLFLGTNAVGLALRLVTGYSQWWERYFGDIRYSPFLSKYYTFDTMLWGMALLVALALVCTVALRKRVTPLDGLIGAILVGLGLVYPVLFPAGLLIVGCFLLLSIGRLPGTVPEYTRWETVRLGVAVLVSVLVVLLYLGAVTADREAAAFARSGLSDIRTKAFRSVGALGPFVALAVLPVIRVIRIRHGPTLLLTLAALTLAACYILIDLTQLEYKYVLAATICLSPLAAAAVDEPFRGRPRLALATGGAVVIGLVVVNLLFVFQAGGHVPGNLKLAPQLDETSFWLSLDRSEEDSGWTRAIQEYTPENTVVVARKRGVQLSALVGRSMYVPSDVGGGQVPGYNLDQRFYLLDQRGYSADVYDQRLAVVETLYSSADEAEIEDALRQLTDLARPLAIHFSSQDTYALTWLRTQRLGEEVFSDGRNTVWVIENPSSLP